MGARQTFKECHFFQSDFFLDSKKISPFQILKQVQNNINRNLWCSLNRYFVWAIFFCFLSCNEGVVFESYKSLEGAAWKKNDSVAFTFTVSDTLNKQNLFFVIRNNQSYEYSNLFLISKLQFPNGKKVIDTLEYEMADNKGRFLGHGFTSRKESKLYYKENSIFPVAGNYTISIYQAMRKGGETEGIKTLKGITDVGIRIENKSGEN